MTILIVEDEAIASDRIQQMVKENIRDAEIVGLCNSIDETVSYLRSNPMPDLLLMDIELSDGKSFDIFEEVNVTSPVIFTTAYDEYVMKAFSVHSIDYLLKPIQVDDLKKSISKFRTLNNVYGKLSSATAQELLQELRKTTGGDGTITREHFLVKQGHRLISISVDEIAFFYSEERITFLVTHNGKQYLLDQPLEELEQQVSSRRFFRCSRKYLVERRSIINVIIHFNGKLKLELKPSSKDDVIVSRDRAPEFKKWLGG